MVCKLKPIKQFCDGMEVNKSRTSGQADKFSSFTVNKQSSHNTLSLDKQVRNDTLSLVDGRTTRHFIFPTKQIHESSTLSVNTRKERSFDVKKCDICGSYEIKYKIDNKGKVVCYKCKNNPRPEKKSRFDKLKEVARSVRSIF